MTPPPFPPRLWWSSEHSQTWRSKGHVWESVSVVSEWSGLVPVWGSGGKATVRLVTVLDPEDMFCPRGPGNSHYFLIPVGF